MLTLTILAFAALAPLCKHADQWIKRHIIVSRRLKAVAECRMVKRPVWL